MADYRLHLGNCLDILPTLESGSVDLVLSDPPYPEIDRAYGRMTEAEWHTMMHAVVPEVRRILKPTGSAVFILQPNSRKVGSMRPWLWEFMSWVCREWNMVQDAWWWNYNAMPSAGATTQGLLRGSLKTCVWCGPSACYRDQGAVLWEESQENIRRRLAGRCGKFTMPSGREIDWERAQASAVRRGGTTPFNVLPISGICEEESKAGGRHGAMTPLALCFWWVRYLCPLGGTVLDCFSGTATVGVAALKLDRHYIGIDTMPEYHAIARKRLAEANGPLFAQK